MLTWIKGQNSSGKTLLIKKMLGAKFEPRHTPLPLDRIQNPLDIERDFPAKLTPSDFIFYYDPVMPKHTTLDVKASRIRIFLEKRKGFAKEYNRIFRLFEKYESQEKVLNEKKSQITELETAIHTIKERNRDRMRQHNEEIQRLKNQIAERKREEVRADEISREMETIEETPVYHEYRKLLRQWNGSRNDSDWKSLRAYEESNEKEIGLIGSKLKNLMDERDKLWMKRRCGYISDLEIELQKTEKEYPDTDYTYREERQMDWLRKNYERSMKNLIKQSDIFTLIRAYPFGKAVWINGRPSSDFSDFYDLLMEIRNLSPEKLFISHCGSELWFRSLPRSIYTHLPSGRQVTLDLSQLFKSVYIEVPSSDERVTVVSSEARQICLV